MGGCISFPTNPDNTLTTQQRQNWLLECMKKAEILNFFPDEQKRHLVQSMDRRATQPGETIIEQQAAENKNLYVLESGEVEVYIYDQKVRTLHPGDNFGELSFAFGCIRSATCKMSTENPGVLWVLNHDTFQETIAQTLKEDGRFMIVRQHSDMAPNPDQPDEYTSDMRALEEAGIRDTVMRTEETETYSRVVSRSFLRRVSDQGYQDYPSMIDRNIALLGETDDVYIECVE